MKWLLYASYFLKSICKFIIFLAFKRQIHKRKLQ
jgi:hypothetical protein